MPTVSDCSTCGQYPASLFKSSNELQGVESQTDTQRLAATLAEDKVTLSSDAVSLAQAELKAGGQTDNNANSLSVVNPTNSVTTANTATENENSLIDQFASNSARTTFYARA